MMEEERKEGGRTRKQRKKRMSEGRKKEGLREREG